MTNTVSFSFQKRMKLREIKKIYKKAVNILLIFAILVSLCQIINFKLMYKDYSIRYTDECLNSSYDTNTVVNKECPICKHELTGQLYVLRRSYCINCGNLESTLNDYNHCNKCNGEMTKIEYSLVTGNDLQKYEDEYQHTFVFCIIFCISSIILISKFFKVNET